MPHLQSRFDAFPLTPSSDGFPAIFDPYSFVARSEKPSHPRDLGCVASHPAVFHRLKTAKTVG
jgi:hypothetical protein